MIFIFNFIIGALSIKPAFVQIVFNRLLCTRAVTFSLNRCPISSLPWMNKFIDVFVWGKCYHWFVFNFFHSLQQRNQADGLKYLLENYHSLELQNQYNVTVNKSRRRLKTVEAYRNFTAGTDGDVAVRNLLYYWLEHCHICTEIYIADRHGLVENCIGSCYDFWCEMLLLSLCLLLSFSTSLSV